MHGTHIKRDPCLIYGDDPKKIYWEIFIALLLMFVCIVIPYRLAMNSDAVIDETGVEHPSNFRNLNDWEILLFCIDAIFLLDLVI